MINCIVHTVRTYLKTNDSIKVICPTGNSANLVSGVTIHKFLKVPTGPKFHKDMLPPEGKSGEELQKNCEGLVCLLVDERSLIGCKLLAWMEFQCRHGMYNGAKSNEEWGGLPAIIFFGDDLQLPPVCDSPLYRKNLKTTNCIYGSLCWNSFSDVIFLNKIVRQNEEEKNLRDVLLSLRTYSINANQAQWLQQFQWDNLKKNMATQ